jgi:anti-sigma B factor antagonist
MTSSDELRLSKARRERTHILYVGGAVDFSVAEEFRAGVEDAVATANSPLIVDLGNVSFLDSSGISTLVRAYHAMKARGDYFALVVNRPMIMRVLSICRLDSIFEIHRDLDAAVAAAMV